MTPALTEDDRRGLTPPAIVFGTRSAPGPEIHGRLFDDVSFGLAHVLIEDALQAQGQPSAEAMALGQRFTHAARQAVTPLLLQTVALELRLASVVGLLDGRTGAERYGQFMRAANSPGFRDYLLVKYPVIAEKVSIMVRNLTRLLGSAVEYYEQDRTALQRELAFGAPDARVVDVIPLGDPHNGGLRASRILLDTGESAMLKFRSAAPEEALRRVLDHVEGVRGISIAETLERGDHHWQRWLDTVSTRDASHYRSMGGWIALAYYTGTKDLHAENLLATEDAIVAVDLECVFNSVLAGKPSERAVRLANFDQVSTTGILPVRMGSSVAVRGINVGVIGAVDGDRTGLPYWDVSQDGTDRLVLRRRMGEAQDIRDDQTIREVLEHERSITRGFEEMSTALARAAGTLVAEVSAATVATRTLVRPTQIYMDAKMKAYHPSALTSRSTQLSTISEALRQRAAYGTEHVVEAEAVTLFQEDIPSYYVDAEDSSFPIADLTVDVTPGIETVVRRIRSLDDQAQRHRHLATIGKHLAVYSSPLDPDRAYLLPPQAADRAAPSTERIRALLGELVQSIMAERVSAAPSLWLNVNRMATNRWTTRVSQQTLYEGLPGVFLAMAKAARLGIDSALPAAEELGAELVALAAEHDRLPALGAFDGRAGLAYAIAGGIHLQQIPDSDGAAAIGSILRSIDADISQLEGFDVVSGAAGLILVVSELATSGYADPELADSICCAAIAHLDATSQVIDDEDAAVWLDSFVGDWLGGVSHGVAGVAWACHRYLDGSGSRARRAASDLRRMSWRAQSSLSTDDPFRWTDRRPENLIGTTPPQVWCHGAEGILLSLMDRNAADERAALSLLDLPLSTNPCVCHGAAGRAIALLEVRDRLGEPRAVDLDRAIDDALGVVIARCDQADRLMAPLETMNDSFMVGRAGMLWALACAIDDDNAVQPTMLRLPRRE